MSYFCDPALHTSRLKIPSGWNKIDDKSYDHFLFMQATFESNKQYSDEKMKKLTQFLTGMITSMMDQIKN